MTIRAGGLYRLRFWPVAFVDSTAPEKKSAGGYTFLIWRRRSENTLYVYVFVLSVPETRPKAVAGIKEVGSGQPEVTIAATTLAAVVVGVIGLGLTVLLLREVKDMSPAFYAVAAGAGVLYWKFLR